MGVDPAENDYLVIALIGFELTDPFAGKKVSADCENPTATDLSDAGKKLALVIFTKSWMRKKLYRERQILIS